MISIASDCLDSRSAKSGSLNLAPYAVAAQRKLDAIREYVSTCAADELDPSTILELIDADPVHD